MQPFKCCPVRRIKRRCIDLATNPACSLYFKTVKHIRCRTRRGRRQPWLVYPLAHWHTIERQVFPEIGLKICRCNTLKRKVIKIAAKKSVECIAPHYLFEVPEKQSPFFVRNLCHPFIGITPAELSVQNLITCIEPVEVGVHRLHT